MPRHLAPILAALLIPGFAASAQASPNVAVIPPPLPPPAIQPAPDPRCRPAHHCRPYRRYHRASAPPRYRHFRGYWRDLRHRGYRRYRSYRSTSLPYGYRRPYHLHGGPYLGYGVGYLGLIRPEGAYRHLQPLVSLTPYVGWNFNPLFALELGYSSTLLRERDGKLGDVKSPGLFNITLDLKIRLIEPTRLRYVVPYLQTGLGIAFLEGTLRAQSPCDRDRSFAMGHGGTLSVGGGLDIYLASWATLGARALYRPLLLSALRCGPGQGAQCAVDSRPFHRLHAWSAEINLAFTWPG